MMEETLGIAVGSGAVGAICGVAGAWIRAKYGRARIPQPLETHRQPVYVTTGECKQHRCAIESRITDEHSLLQEIVRALKENDRRAEDRAVQVNRRLDPMVEELGRLRGRVDTIDRHGLADRK